MRTGFPLARPGQRIGILGGSFDPAHQGHLLISQVALRRLGLERVWWLVSPGNPLKAHGPAPLATRIAAARATACDPRILVTDIEARLGLRKTADTLHALARLYPEVRFVWLMGSDNLASFHRWRGWTDIMRLMPVAVIARPGSLLDSRTAPAAARFAGFRVPDREAGLLPTLAAPAWTYLTAPLNPLSSTAIRTAETGRAPA